MIPHSRPTLDQVDLNTWGGMLESGHLAPGRFCRTLESRFVERILARDSSEFRARAVQSGTAALHIGLCALKILREQDGKPTGNLEVITSTLACAALVQAIRAVGAQPVLLDVTPDGNLDVNLAAECVSVNTLAVVVPHLYGKPVDVSPLMDLEAPVLEDCAQTLGVETPSGRVGAVGHLMMTSFYATKPICTGQGGLVATGDERIADTIDSLCVYDGRSDGGPGWNACLSDWAAALAIPQVDHFEESLKRRARIARSYHEALREFSDRLTLPSPTEQGEHGWYRYVLLLRENSSRIASELTDLGVEAKRPVYLPQHRIFGIPGDFPNAEEHWLRSLSIPIYPTLTDLERERVIEALIQALST